MIEIQNIYSLSKVLGIVTFKEEVKQCEIEQISKEKPFSMLLHDDEWDITSNRYRKLKESQTLKMIQQLKIKSLKMRWNSAKSIIYDINHLKFPHLKELYLNGNDIENLQALTLIPFSKLQVLNFKENNICKIKALRKCQLPQLSELMLYKNKIQECSELCALGGIHLDKLWITPQNESYDFSENLSWTLKLQSTKITSLFVKHEKAEILNFEKVQKMIKKKYWKVSLIYQLKDDINLQLE